MRILRLALISGPLLSGLLSAVEPSGADIYQARCASCHDSGTNVRIPKRAEIAARTPEAIVSAMASGIMATQASGLTTEERIAVARFLTGKDVGVAVNSSGAAKCDASAKPLAMGRGDWNGWGMDTDNSRFQPNPGLTAADVPRLKLKWAFGYEGARSAATQPSVVGGRVFAGGEGGAVYSLDAKTGCVYWTMKADAGVRTAVVVAKAKSQNGYVAYFGDARANFYAVDAESGQTLWKIKMDNHPASRITGAPKFHAGRLYVPVSSVEEAFAAQPKYECCTFRGALAALDAETGKEIWRSYTIPDAPKPYRKSRVDTQMFGPAGAAVWSSPTLDLERNLVYVTTGDSYTGVDADTDDAIIAFHMDTGAMVWHRQTTAKDNFVVGCPNVPNCPEAPGPDHDFGSSAILRSIGGGKQVLVAGQKSGTVWGLDPDRKGEILWHTKVGHGGALGGVQWGQAADGKNVYAPISDRFQGANAKPGLHALDLATGNVVWSAPSPTGTCTPQPGRRCEFGYSAAVSVIPGVVFAGSLDGHFRAFSTGSGEILLDFDASRKFDTVNGVAAASGGSIDSGGAAIVDGMVFTHSGYINFGGTTGNVLLAFSVDGK